MTRVVSDLSLPLSGDRLERRQRISFFYDKADLEATYAEVKALLAAYPWTADAHITEAALL
jgi:hypothetical protein